MMYEAKPHANYSITGTMAGNSVLAEPTRQVGRLEQSLSALQGASLRDEVVRLESL